MAAITWKDVLARTDLVGGDIETQEDGRVFRGPIRSVRNAGNTILFETHWAAVMERPGVWKKYGDANTAISVEMSWATPSDVGQGRVAFSIPFVGMATIFPKGGSKLDPKKVKGLEADSWEEPI